MHKLVGIWVDRERSKIITLIDKSVDVKEIKSGVGGHFRMSGGSRSKVAYGPMSIADERKVDRKRKQQLQKYYSDVIKQVSQADKIFIFGPGKAKVELKKRLEEVSGLSKKVSAVEAVDKMSEKQMIAKVKSYYSVAK